MSAEDRTAQQFRKMTETPIPKLILSLAAPTILSMLITSIYNLADTFFVGQISTSASGAVGVVSSLMAIIQALGFMLGHGAGSIISRSLGSQNTKAATRFASTSFFTALTFGLILAAVGLTTLPHFMMLLGSTETILPHACAYARPILIAAPLMMSSLVMNNILRYEGKASFAMIGLVTGGVLNMVLDPVFIFRFGLGTAGAGIATALSQSISFCILLSMFLRGKTVSQFQLSAVTRSPAEFGTILMTGLPSFGRQGLNSIGGMLLNIAARSYGDAAVALPAFHYQCLAILLQPVIVVANMTFQSVGKAGRATFLACCRQGVFFIPLILILPHTFGLVGVEICQPIADALTFIVSLPFLLAFLKQLDRMDDAEKAKAQS